MHTFYTITAQQIAVLRGCSYPTARKEWKRVSDILGGSRQIMLKELAAVWNVQTEDLAKSLYLTYKKQAA
jgi:hypothetical protein